MPKFAGDGSYNYKYNGKELQDELGLNMYDYGMRNYDPALGRWMNIDPKAELLEISSPYVYALNCPIIYLDRDGELPILINGHVSDDSERASASYWGTEIINTIKGSGIANPGGQFHYVDGDRGVMSDGRTEERYPQYRVAGGRMQADADWNTILSKLEKDPKTGKIIEKIQIYTHSRGAAFGQGYTERLLQLIKENSDMFENASSEVDFVFDMAPHQSGYLNAVKGTSTYTMDHEGDPLSDNDKSGVNAAFTSGETTKGAFGSHKIGSFAKDIKEFAKAFTQGKSTQSVIDTFVKNMKDKYGIKVEVEQ
jgi:RHS repeat-associated protein